MLEMFWKNHDPTSKCSRQYMSAIFYHNEEQKKLAELTKEIQSNKRARPIQTSIVHAKEFYDAEDYHQKYLLQRHPKVLVQLDIEPGEQLVRSFVATRLNGYLGGYGSLKAFDGEKDKLALPPKIEEYVRKQVKHGKGNGVDC